MALTMTEASYGLLAPRASKREIALWSCAAVLTLTLHGAAFWLTQQSSPATEAAAEAAPAMMVDLAPMLVMPDAVPLDIAELVDSAESQAEEVPTEITENEIVPPEEVRPEDVAEAEPVEAVRPEIVENTESEVAETVTDAAEPVETANMAEAVPEALTENTVQEAAEALPVSPDEIEETIVATSETAEVTLPEMVETVPTSAPRQEIAKPVKQAAKEPEPKQQAKAPPRKTAAKKPPPSLSARKSALNAPKAAAPRATKPSRSTGISPARWQSRLNAHLNRHKRFPSGARGKGDVTVRFAIDPNGRVLAASVARSSGEPVFDQAALDMVNRASPVPAPPPEIAKPRMSLTVPVRFSRR